MIVLHEAGLLNLVVDRAYQSLAGSPSGTFRLQSVKLLIGTVKFSSIRFVHWNVALKI